MMSNPDYKLLEAQLRALLDGETDALANASNFVGLMFLPGEACVRSNSDGFGRLRHGRDHTPDATSCRRSIVRGPHSL